MDSNILSSSKNVGVTDKATPTGLSTKVPELMPPTMIEYVAPLKKIDGKRSIADKVGRAITSFLV